MTDTLGYKNFVIKQMIEELQKKLARLIKYNTDAGEKAAVALKIKNLQDDLGES